MATKKSKKTQVTETVETIEVSDVVAKETKESVTVEVAGVVENKTTESKKKKTDKVKNENVADETPKKKKKTLDSIFKGKKNADKKSLKSEFMEKLFAHRKGKFTVNDNADNSTLVTANQLEYIKGSKYVKCDWVDSIADRLSYEDAVILCNAINPFNTESISFVKVKKPKREYLGNLYQVLIDITTKYELTDVAESYQNMKKNEK